MISPLVSSVLRVMLYDDQAVPLGGAGMFTARHLEGLTTVLMNGENGVMRSVETDTVTSWGASGDAEVWEAAIGNSFRCEAAQLQSLAPKAPGLFVLTSGNRISGTLLSAHRIPDVTGRFGCMVSYPDKDACCVARFDEPETLDLARLHWLTQQLTPGKPVQEVVPVWWSRDGAFERLDVAMRDGNLSVAAGPKLRAVLSAAS